MAQPLYPLQQVLEVKQKRVEDAEKVVVEKQQALEKEQNILKEKEAARDKVKDHYKDKLNQMRAEMDQGSTTDKLQQMKIYLKEVKEKLAGEEKKVNDQKKQVETAEANLEAARENLRVKRQEVDKLLIHQTDWLREMRKEQAIIEEREQDEIGSVIHLNHQRRNQKKTL